jgi:hypothetical protein
MTGTKNTGRVEDGDARAAAPFALTENFEFPFKGSLPMSG